MNIQLPIRSIYTALLVLMWTYAALSKLLDFAEFRWQLSNQELPRSWSPVLSVLLPALELISAGMITCWPRRTSGWLLSTGLLIVFTTYIALILAGITARVPCSCGGILSKLGWREHLIFNLFFLVLSIMGYYRVVRSTGEAENLRTE